PSSTAPLTTPLAAPLPPDVILPASADPSVSFAVWFRVGSQDDPKGKEGLAWLTAQMVARAATASHRYDEILTLLYPMAASYSASVDREMTVLSGRSSKTDGAAFLQLLREAMTQPAFDAADFERLRTEGLSSLEKSLRYSLDEELGKAILHEALYRGSAYAHPVIGTVAGLKALTLDDVKAFWARHYAMDQAIYGLAGGWSEELKGAFLGTRTELPTPQSAGPAPAPAAAPVTGKKVVLVQKPGADASISFGHVLDVRRGDPDFAALYLAASWLGEHRNSSSHLYQVIREARGLNYGDYAYVEAYPGGGFRQLPPANVGRRKQAFEVWIRTLPNDNAVFALRAALREVDTLVAQGLTAQQFELTRNFLKKYVLHYAASTQDRLLWSLDDAFYGLPAPHLARLRAELDALTLEQVNAAIKKHLRTSALTIAISTGAAEKLKAQLTSGAATPPTYATPKPEAVLTEDKIIAAYPLGISADHVTIVPVEQMFAQGTR
ncbi:MAG TPA: pitrilysin family protein, partial [Kofleriaceae bacterium]|nr:pitrilysin family protein [Kofleriaceae bacterium]